MLSSREPYTEGDFADQPKWSETLLHLGRPIWQLAIVGLYAVSSDKVWFRAVMAVAAAMYIANSILLSTQTDDARWKKMQFRLLHLELGASFLLAVFMLLFSPRGPVSLLLLPTMLTYAWLGRDGDARREVWSVLLTVTIYITSIQLALMNGNSTTSVSNIFFSGQAIRALSAADVMTPAFYLLFGLYFVVITFASVLAWLVRRQWQERTRFREAAAQMQYQSEQLGRVNDEVNRYAARVYDLAAVEERNRIAGEIHDTVAHRLTALLVQLQGARRMMEGDDIESASENMRVSEALAREALDEVRKSVRAVGGKTTGKEGIAALRRLSLYYASLTGTDIQFTADPEVETLPPEFMGMLYRVVQEGLTNAQRHGRATVVEITLKRAGLKLQLDIRDNGRGAAEPSLGFGLSSMRTRFQRYGGDIKVTSEPGKGFLLQLNLPMWEASKD
ncbi:sensor histidine kinase [Alicyclobacillus sp. SO9]|uniref:sensor histidine kinase n=1 Tax=Alicyclobacillus sp. SO9 TaxID=2665646 RepID=UPI0018E88E61|nr:sensor histidine kinase [Alicyclobacillus sp. SO9]QQE78585.1 sensor histidine kinase [Alicyclobacillus sp. SO9]